MLISSSTTFEFNWSPLAAVHLNRCSTVSASGKKMSIVIAFVIIR